MVLYIAILPFFSCWLASEPKICYEQNSSLLKMSHLSHSSLSINEYVEKNKKLVFLHEYYVTLKDKDIKSFPLSKINLVAELIENGKEVSTIDFANPNRVFSIEYDTHRGIMIRCVLETDNQGDIKCKDDNCTCPIENKKY